MEGQWRQSMRSEIIFGVAVAMSHKLWLLVVLRVTRGPLSGALHDILGNSAESATRLPWDPPQGRSPNGTMRGQVML